ncbi:MAG: hypothetical protein GY714_01775 [Desulfobacterales bacterium]|nr:hypothetical protein [Desulfobacterales bacterium]
MHSLTHKLEKLDSFLDDAEKELSPDRVRIIKLMRRYRESVEHRGVADLVLVEFLDSLGGEQIPINNSFIRYMLESDKEGDDT